CLPLLLQLGFIGTMAEIQNRQAEAEKWLVHSKEVRCQTQMVLTKLISADLGNRGLTLLGPQIYATSFDRSTRELQEALQQLQSLVSDNLSQTARAQLIASQADQLIAWHAENLSLIRRGARDAVVERMKGKQGEQLTTAIQNELGAFQDEEERLDQ